MTKEIREEWRTHASHFTSKWLASMTARKKCRYVESNSLEGIRSALDSQESLADTGGATLDRYAIAAIRKDLLLIDASRSEGADAIIFSLDNRMRAFLVRLSDHCDDLGGVHWVNPVEQSDEAIAWLRAGAEPNGQFKLAD